jgi:outer membrane lipase/esterase
MYSHCKIVIALILYFFALSFSSTSLAFNMKDANHIYFLGDSLFDTGYMDASSDFVPTGQDPVYTTPHGHVTPYYISHKYNKADQANNVSPPAENTWVSGRLNGNDYAAGGAVTDGKGIGFAHYYPPALTYQVDKFLKEHKILPKDIFIVWVGANDILKTYITDKDKSPEVLATDEITAVDKATTTISGEVNTLISAGAKHIVVLNMPPIGDTPLLSSNEAFKQMGNLVSSMFNMALSNKLNKLTEKPAIFNVNQLFTDITTAINDKGKYTEPDTSLTLTNDTKPACNDSITNPMQLAINCKHWVKNPADYLFADGVHPSDTAHQILALHLEKFLSSPDVK